MSYIKYQPADYDGLKVKYRVTKIEDGTPVEGCFVLRPDKDPAAVAALRAYAGATDNERLAGDIVKWVGGPAQPADLQAAFALACRILADFLDCPAAEAGADWPECEDEAGCRGDRAQWACWQKRMFEIVSTERVCRVCGCTQHNACPGGCSWVEEDLCSGCAERSAT